jgi:hypothetical protein
MRTLALALLVLTAAAAAGCQLAVEFDRSRLGDEATPDAALPLDADAGHDASREEPGPDAGDGDAGRDGEATDGG